VWVLHALGGDSKIAGVRLDPTERRELRALFDNITKRTGKLEILRFPLPGVAILLIGMTSPSNPKRCGGNEYREFTVGGTHLASLLSLFQDWMDAGKGIAFERR